TAEPLEPLLDRIVVVAAAGVDRDDTASVTRLAIGVGAVIEAEDDDGFRFRPKHLRVAAPRRLLGHPAHLAVIALAEKLGEALACRLGEPRLGETDRVEAD